jgi:cytochrome oxidase Cu insertion factor (SCO1/SenC/PrrC family)
VSLIGHRNCVFRLTVFTGVLGFALIVAAFGVAGARASAPALHGDAVWRAGAHRAPEVALVDQSGRRASIGAERGRLVLITFLDSLCTRQCPIAGRELAGLRAGLRNLPVTLLVVSVDPADRPDTVKTFLTKAGVPQAARNWSVRWLMGSHAQLSPVWARYGVTVVPQDGDIAHSLVLYLVDSRGYERAGYLMPFLTNSVVADARAISTVRHPWWHLW